MQINVISRGRFLAGLALCAGLAAAAAPAPTVLVTDFQAPPGAAWAWARRGLPELAVEALGERGVATVDRDLLSVVSAEHGLAAGRETAQGGLQMGQWLGAAYLLAGSVETVRVDRVRLSGTLTRVETAEQVGVCSVEGDFKKDLQALMGRLVAGLTRSADLGKQAAVPEKVNPVKPEALMFFQQGIDACAAGKPALAAGFFLSAEDMDPRLRAAKEWEAHAYELGGLPRYATAVREHAAALNASTSSVASASAATQTAQRVVSVLTPVWLGGTNAAAGSPAMPALRLSEEEAVLACKGVRLYRPESLAEAVAETDRQLSLQFNLSGASRYARWLAADAVLYSTLTPQAKGLVGLEVGLMDALTARRLKQVKREVSPAQVKSALAAAVRECLDGWQAAAETRGAGDTSLSNGRPPLSDEDAALLPDFRQIAKVLDARMRGAATLKQNQMLTDFYAYRENADLAAAELDEVLRQAEVRAPDMDARLAWVYWWVSGYPSRDDVKSNMGKRWCKGLLDNAAISQAIGVKGRNRVGILRARLLAEYPSSVGTYAVLHREAVNAFDAGQWALCLTNAAAAWAALEAGERTGPAGRSRFDPELLRQFDEKQIKASIRFNCLYLQGAAARRLGDHSQANQIFEQIPHVPEQETHKRSINCAVPIVEFDGEHFNVRHGQSYPLAYFERELTKEREALAVEISDHRQMEAAVVQDAALAERVRLLAERNVKTPEEYLRLLREIAQVWKALPPVAHAQCVLADAAVKPVAEVGRLPADERRAAARDLSREYLRVTGVDPDRLADSRSPELIAPRLQRVVRFYRSVGLGAEGLSWANALLGKPVDPAFGRGLIEALVGELADCVTGPVEQSFYARPGGVTFTASEDDPQIRAISGFFEQHKGLPGVAAVQAKFWQTLGDRAIAHCGYGVWYAANIRARACDRTCALSQKTDNYVARLALASCTQDVLLAAIQMREALGPSPKPAPFMSWYAAGFLCVFDGAYEQALKSFQLFRETYNEAELTYKGFRLSETDSDQSVFWSLEYLEGVCLAATGHAAEAAPRLRRLAQRFGARPIYLWTETSAEGGGFLNEKPLGLLAAEALQKLHADENGGNPRAEQPTKR